jgi:hypothetical protein
MLLSEQLQRNFKLALADETPGSNHVGNDVDSQRGFQVCGIIHCGLAH